MSRFVWRLIAWGSTIALLVLCFLPGDSLPDTQTSGADKLFHALAFFVVGYSWRRSGLRAARVVWIGALLAIGTEVGQALMGVGRNGDVLDAIADMLGVLLGLLVAARLRPLASNAPEGTRPTDHESA